MTARQRVLALKYLEKQKRNYEFAKKLGVEVTMTDVRDVAEYESELGSIKWRKVYE